VIDDDEHDHESGEGGEGSQGANKGSGGDGTGTGKDPTKGGKRFRGGLGSEVAADEEDHEHEDHESGEGGGGSGGSDGSGGGQGGGSGGGGVRRRYRGGSGSEVAADGDEIIEDEHEHDDEDHDHESGEGGSGSQKGSGSGTGDGTGKDPTKGGKRYRGGSEVAADEEDHEHEDHESGEGGGGSGGSGGSRGGQGSGGGGVRRRYRGGSGTDAAAKGEKGDNYKDKSKDKDKDKDSDSDDNNDLTLYEGVNDFGFELTDELYPDLSNTVWISSFCISSCFSLIYPGTNGNTKTEIAQVLNYPLSEDPENILKEIIDTQDSMEDMYDGVKSENGHQSSIIGISNKIYVSSDITLKQTYIDTLSIAGDDLITYDFDFTANDAKDTINDWVSDNTNELIDEIISDDMDITDWKLAALNAIYLNGTFYFPFDTEMTSKQKFYSDSSREIEVDDIHLMHQKNYFDYYCDNDYQYLKFKFDDEHKGLYIVFALPLNDKEKEGDDMLLDREDLLDVMDKFEEGVYIALALPKLDIEQEYILSDGILQDMGMNDAFDPFKADFSEMTDDPTEPLYIDKVIHKTMVKMDEYGLVAAAVTAIGISKLSLPPVPVLFKADHPFQMFIIDEQHEDIILFSGKIDKPGIPEGSGDEPTFDELSDNDNVWMDFDLEKCPTVSDIMREYEDVM